MVNYDLEKLSKNELFILLNNYQTRKQKIELLLNDVETEINRRREA